MKFKLILKVLGALMMLMSLAMLPSLIYGLLNAGHQQVGLGVNALISSCIGSFVLGVSLFFSAKMDRKHVSRKDAIIIVGLGWIICGIVGAFPYWLTPVVEPLSFAQSIFESFSGFTTTGSTVINDLTLWPKEILLWRSLTQWLGGVGILVLFVAVLSSLGVGSKSLFQHESSFEIMHSSTARIKDVAWLLLKIYLIFTTACALGLLAMGLTPFDAICHACTTVSTGGFSPHNASIAYYDDWGNAWVIQLWITLFMLLCSFNFLIYTLLLKRKWKQFFFQEESFSLFILLMIATAVITLGVYQMSEAQMAAGFLETLRRCLFMVVAIASTTGFGLEDYELWPTYSIIILLALMFIGGCSGATAGGIKLGRVLTALKACHLEITKTFRPNYIDRVNLNSRNLDAQTVAHTLAFVMLFVFITFLSVLVVALMEMNNSMDLLTAFGAVVATLPNIGPGLGEVGPTDNFAGLNDWTLYFLSLLMALGRLELYAILALIVPAMWKRF